MTRYNSSTSSVDLRDLQQSVNSLLKQIDRACHTIIERHEEAGGAAVAEEEMEQVEAPDAESDASDEETEAMNAATDEELVAQVDDLIADAVDSTESLAESIEEDADLDPAAIGADPADIIDQRAVIAGHRLGRHCHLQEAIAGEVERHVYAVARELLRQLRGEWVRFRLVPRAGDDRSREALGRQIEPAPVRRVGARHQAVAALNRSGQRAATLK